MRRLPLASIGASAVAHVVAVMLLILVVERLTSLPGLFIDLTTHATEPGDASGDGGSSRETKPPALSPRRASAPSPAPAPPRALSSTEAPETSRHAQATSAADRVPDPPPPTNVVPSANAPVSVDAPASASASVSGDAAQPTSTVASPGTSGVETGRSGGSEESLTLADGVSGGSRLGARAGQGLALATPGVSAGGGPGGGAPPVEYAEYLAQLRQRIQESLRYPLPARRRGLSGTVHLEVTIRPDGAIAAVTIVESSSHAALDDAALEAVRSLRPMPFPTGVPPRRLYVRVPVIFRLP